MSSSSIESSCSYRTGQQQMESIKGIMWRAGNVLNSEEENLFRVTATNCQPDLSLSNRITTDSSPPPPDLCSCFFMHLSAASSDTFRLHFSFLFTAFIALSPQHPLSFSPPLYPILSIPPSFSPPLSDTLSNLSTCFLSPPETWYKVRGEQRDRSDDPRESPLLMHEHKQQLYTDYISKMYCVVRPLQNLHFQ